MAMAINERLAAISRANELDRDSSDDEVDKAQDDHSDDSGPSDQDTWDLHSAEREFPQLVSLFELGA